MTLTDTIASNQTALRASGSVLGAITYWTLSHFSMPRDKFRAELTGMGLAAALGRDLSPRAALTRACEMFSRGKPGWGTKRLRAGAVALLRFEERRLGVVSAVHELTAAVDSSGTLVFHTVAGSPESAAMRASLEVSYAEVRDTASTADLSGVLTSAMAGTRKDPMFSAVSLRGSTGGVYLVPAAKLEQLEDLRQWVVSSGPGCQLSTFLVADLGENAGQTRDAVARSLEEELVALRASVLEFAAECEGDKAAGLKCFNARAARYDDLSAKVDLWAGMLGGVAEELKAAIKGAADSLSGDLGFSPAPAKKQTAPVSAPEVPAPAPKKERKWKELFEGSLVPNEIADLLETVLDRDLGDYRVFVTELTAYEESDFAAIYPSHAVLGCGAFIIRKGAKSPAWVSLPEPTAEALNKAEG